MDLFSCFEIDTDAKMIDLASKNISRIVDLSDYADVKELRLSDNLFTDLNFDSLPPFLEILNVSGNLIDQVVGTPPETLHIFICDDCQFISSLPDFSETKLRVLSANN